jgi:hypothetical protein
MCGIPPDWIAGVTVVSLDLTNSNCNSGHHRTKSHFSLPSQFCYVDWVVERSAFNTKIFPGNELRIKCLFSSKGQQLINNDFFPEP